MDYDLVVIGVSDAAYRLVVEASRLEARVAWLIDPKTEQKLNKYELAYGLDILASLSTINTNLHSKLSDLSAKHLQQQDSIIFESKQSAVFNHFIYPLTMMNIKGVDIIESQQIEQKIEPQAPIYAIASLSPTPQRQVFGLAKHPYLTATDVCNWGFQALHQASHQELPNSIAILGSDSLACTIAQITNLLGIHTTLLVDHPHILPHVDVEVARTLQAKLEIEGIAVHTQAQVTAVDVIEGRSRVWLNQQTIDCDHLLIPIPERHYPIPNSQSILPCHSDRDIAKIINQIPHLAKSIVPPKYPVVTVTATQPPIAQVGLNAAIAQQKHQLNILETVTTDGGLCKIIYDLQGQVLGASMYGAQAELVISAVAIAMQGKVRLQELNLPNLQLERKAL